MRFLSGFKISSILDVLWPDASFWSSRRPEGKPSEDRSGPGILDKPK